MPWTGKSFKSKHNKSLSSPQSRKAAKIANAILKRTGDEGLSIATANARVEGKPRNYYGAGRKTSNAKSRSRKTRRYTGK